MVLIHRRGAEPALPEVAGLLLPRMDGARIGAVQPRQRPPQAVGVGRRQDQVHVVGHQAPAPDGDVGVAAMGHQQVTIERVVGIAEEHARTAVAARTLRP